MHKNPNQHRSRAITPLQIYEKNIHTNANLYLGNINAHKKIVEFCPFVIKILSRNKVLTSIKSYHSVTKLPKMTHNNAKLDLVNINAYIKQNLVKFCSFVLKI